MCRLWLRGGLALTWRKLRSVARTLRLRATTFSLEEIDALRNVSPSELVDRFFDYWTLKEAYLKARGVGLNLPLDQFSILISSGQKIGIRFMPGMADDPRRWHFTRCTASARYRLAIADGSGVAGGLPLVVQPWPANRMVSRSRDNIPGTVIIKVKVQTLRRW